jgi:hypothetical protein
MVRITGAVAITAGTGGLTLPGYGVAIVALSLIASGKSSRRRGRMFASINVIAIRPDAKTRKPNWPCRELNHHGNANPLKSLLTVR